jgi:hypothetical protein
MTTRTTIRCLLIVPCLLCCAFLFTTLLPSGVAYSQSIAYSTAVGSEAKSHWKLSLTVSDGAIGEQSAALDYIPDLDSGIFAATLRADNEFGRFRLYSAFALTDYPPGSNVTLVQQGNPRWVNNPASANAQLDDFITLHSALPTVDLAIPVVVRGSFGKSGTPMDSGELGLAGSMNFFARIRHADLSIYNQNRSLRMGDTDYAPGTYWLLFESVPTGVQLRIRFYCSASYTVTDTYQYTESSLPFSQLTDSDITLTEVYRSVPYSLNGTADFSSGILYKWYAASKNGIPVPDLTVTSSTGSTYVPVPYNICPLSDQSRPVQAGATIPVKLQLCDGYGANLSSPGLVLTGTQLKRVSDNEVVPLRSSGRSNADSIFRYDPTLRGYIFTVSTTGLTPGTYQLSFAVGDEPLEYPVHFDVRQ